ncbi:MAG: ABC transporter substrate-binding protein [Deltaproteobacteria bacterium]|nr:ABC transporter substrate-binding protein [Deltaproteobacteria bacterium]
MKTKAISLIVVFLVSLVSFSGQAISQEKVIVTLDWVISGYHAPFFIAKEKGYFKKEGLSVEVKRGFGSGRTTKAVGTGASTLGYADSGVMLKGIAGGLNLKLVSIVYAKSPMVIVSDAAKGIKTPKDLEGKSIGDTKGAATSIMMPIMFKNAGVDASKVKIVHRSPAMEDIFLIQGKVDSSTDYYFSSVAAYGWPDGRKTNTIWFADHGVDIYGIGIMATPETIQSKPKMIRGFLRALFTAYKDMRKDPKGAFDIIAKFKPELKGARKVETAKIRAIWKVILTDEIRKKGFGYINRDKIKRTRDIVFGQYNVKKNVPLDDIYTNEFLPNIKP